jgi:hypothetical protein
MTAVAMCRPPQFADLLAFGCQEKIITDLLTRRMPGWVAEQSQRIANFPSRGLACGYEYLISDDVAHLHRLDVERCDIDNGRELAVGLMGKRSQRDRSPRRVGLPMHNRARAPNAFRRILGSVLNRRTS